MVSESSGHSLPVSSKSGKDAGCKRYPLRTTDSGDLARLLFSGASSAFLLCLLHTLRLSEERLVCPAWNSGLGVLTAEPPEAQQSPEQKRLMVKCIKAFSGHKLCNP